MDEHVEARCIKQIDFGLAPLRVGQTRRNRHLPRNLFVVVVGGSAAIINAAHPLARAGGVQHGRDEGGLSRVPVPHHGYITDIRAFINFHEFAPSAGPLYRPRRDSRPRLSGRAKLGMFLGKQDLNNGGA